jgi:hypothetical protein
MRGAVEIRVVIFSARHQQVAGVEVGAVTSRLRKKVRI